MENSKPFDPFLTARMLVVSVATLLATLGAYADEYTDVYGQTWTYEVSSGTNVKLTGVVKKNLAYDAANFPWTFTNNDTSYTVTEVGSAGAADGDGAFQNWTTLTGTLTIPDSVVAIGGYAFKNTGIEKIASLGNATINFRAFHSTKLNGALKANKGEWRIGTAAFQDSTLSAFYAPGPDAGNSQISVKQTFRGAYSLKVAFFGLNVNTDIDTVNFQYMLQALSGCKMFVPANGQWDGLDPNSGGGTTGNNEAIYYGSNTNLNLIVDDEAGKITAIPTDGVALAKMLEVAPTLKTYFGWDTHITVTNMIEVATGVITEENAKWIHSFNSIVFKVNTQSYLDTLLNVIPSTVPFAIDPCDAKETLTIPQGREVFVRLSGDGRNGSYSPKIKGLTIICR